jgi:hypothetical protein
VLVGIEAGGSEQWFLQLLEELGIDYLVGHPTAIRKAETRQRAHQSSLPRTRMTGASGRRVAEGMK